MKKLYILFLLLTSFAYAQEPFITTWQVQGSDLTIVIPVVYDDENNFDVNFGDGTTVTGQIGPVSHTYINAGIYTVTMSGAFGHIRHNSIFVTSDPEELLTIQQWGDNVWTSMESAFAACSNMTLTATDTPDLSQVTDMAGMFSSCTQFNQSINNWDVSGVTNMKNLFYASGYNQPLNNWDVSNVLQMHGMLSLGIFNQDISSWNFHPDISFYYLSSGDDFVSYSGMDEDNYDSLLLRFAQLVIENKAMRAINVKYCNEEVRAYLINELGWYISHDDLSEDCANNSLSGSVYLDDDSNGCDASDATAVNFLIGAHNGSFNYSTSPSANGNYMLNVHEGGYTVSLLNLPDYFTATPESSTVNFTGFGNSEEINFCITANQSVNDLNVTILPLTDARPGFEADYQLVIQNMGTQSVANATVSLAFDNTLQTFINAAPATTSTTANQLNFAISTLQPFESTTINLTMTTFTPPTVNGGEVINFVATVTPGTNDFTPADNTFNLDQVVVNSFDPNDKRVLQGESIFEAQTDEYLDYIIRFQNTGTASAITVRVEDELHENLDWTTLTPVSSSHDYSVQITDGNQMEFIFNNINLPHEAVNAEGSNGFIAYKIKPVAGIEVGEVMSGDASIFFDYNLPIITNAVTTEVVANLAIAGFESDAVSIYPNPAKGLVHIKLPVGANLQEVKVYNMQGRELLSFMQQDVVSVESLNSGIYIVAVKTNMGHSKHQLIKN